MKFIVFVLAVFSFRAFAVDGSCEANLTEGCFERGYFSATTCSLERTGQTEIEDNGTLEITVDYLCDCENPLVTINFSCGFRKAISPTTSPQKFDQQAHQCGSIINVDSNTVMERIPVAGTPFNLYYSSERSVANQQDYKINVPISGDTYPSDVDSYDITVNFSDRTETENLTAAADLDFDFQWDGKDSSGNYPQAGTEAEVSVSEVAPTRPNPDAPLIYHFDLGGWNPMAVGLGGWTLDVQNFYNTAQGRLYKGNGSARYVKATSIAGGGLRVASEDGSEVYDFDSDGVQQDTRNGLTGTIIYSFTYDTSDRLSMITDAFGNQTSIQRDSSGNLTGISSPDSQITTLTLNSNGLLATVTNPNSESYQMAYWGSQGLLKTFQKPKGLVSTMTYDTSGQLTEDQDSVGALSQLLKTITGYNNSTTTVTSANGFTTTYDVSRSSSSDYSRTTHLPTGSTQTYTVSATNESGSAGGISYNATKSNDPRFGEQAPYPSTLNIDASPAYVTVAKSWNVTLSDSSNPFSIESMDQQVTVNSQITDIAYDGLTKTFTETSPESRTSTYSINTYGQPTSYQLANLTPVTMNYDSRGRLWKIQQGTRSTSWTFDSNGNMNSWTNALNQTTSQTNDSLGRPLSITLPDTRTISYTYDADGSIATLTPSGRSAHSFTTNLWDMISQYLPPSLGGTSTPTAYHYNNDKLLTEIDRPAGQTITLNYSTFGETLSGITTPSDTYSYQTDITTGKISSATEPNSLNTQMSYSAGNLAYEYIYKLPSYGFLGLISYEYDNNLRVSAEQITASDWSTNSRIEYTYDNDGQITSAGSETLTPDAATGFVDSTTLGSITDTYGYNSFGEIISYEAKYGTNTIYSYSLTRDNLGRISEKTETIDGVTSTYNYTYDSSGRLTDVDKNGSAYSHYNYDSNSNITSGNRGSITITATFNGQDELETWGTKSYAYNLNGELESISNTSPSQTFDYTFNDLSQLMSVQTPSGTTNYKVDGLMMRVAKLNGSTLSSWYFYTKDGRLLAEMSDSGQIQKRYVYAAKSNIPDFMLYDGDTYRLISDNLGSVRLVVNTSTGTIAQELDYDEFGNVLDDTNPGFQAFGFAGGMYDPDTSLVHFGARDYDPETGRWISKDPILFGGGDTNLYGYALQDPVNFVDPSGLRQSLNNQGGWEIPSGGRGGGMSDSSGAHLAAGFGGMMAGGTALATSPAWLPTVAGLCLANPHGCQQNLTEFIDSVSGELNGPTTGIAPTTLGGYLGSFTGKGAYLIHHRMCNE